MSIINQIEPIVVLSEQAKGFIKKRIKNFQFKKGEMVLEQNKTCNFLYLVTSGMLRGYYYSNDKEVTNWLAIENEFCTSFYSFLSNAPSYERIEAIENTEVEAIHKDDLELLYKSFPETERVGRVILEQYYMRLEERVVYIQFKSAKERYEHFFTKRTELIKRAPLGCIASYLGITQETLSRIRAEK